MTPMIDVIFLLLVFFVCTASFHAIEEILPTNLSLPGSTASEVPVDPELLDLEEIVVQLLWRDDHIHWRINQRDYAQLTEVAAVLQAAGQLQPEIPVILDIDAPVPLAHVIDVYDVCRRLGLRRVQFAASLDS